MSHETAVQPKLNDLLTRYLEKQAEAQAVGIASYDSEVSPYEVGPVQPLDPKLAWDEALTALARRNPNAGKLLRTGRRWSPITNRWSPSLIARAISPS